MPRLVIKYQNTDTKIIASQVYLFVQKIKTFISMEIRQKMNIYIVI